MICAANGLPCFKDLIAVLFECFSIISLGYLSCRFKLVSSQAKDLNSYLTNFALPMIIFLNIAQMEFRTINLSFLLCALAAKLLVFLTVTLLTLTISYPTNFGYAGSLSILATQSNDFALGYPLIKLLYGESRPEMLNYLSLMAPIQLLILNPLGIAMLEFQKSKNHKSRNHLRGLSMSGKCDSDDKTGAGTVSKPCCQPCGRGNATTNNQHPDGFARSTLAPTEMANSYPHESPAEDSPTKLLQVADLLQTGLVSQPNSSSQPQLPSLIDSPLNVSKSNMPVPNLRKTSMGEERQGLNFRHKNFRSLVLALPAREVRRTSLAEPSFCASTTIQQTHSVRGNSSRYANLSAGGQADETVLKNQTQTSSIMADGRRNSNCSISMSVVVVGSGQRSHVDLSFFKALATNPLILASIVALLVNLLHGPELPKYITRVSNTIAASFAAPALFVVGLSMYGKFELLLRNPRDLLLSSVMVLSKGLLLPSLLRLIALLVVPSFSPPEDVPYLVDFAFLYGLLPTAPTACIIAKQYGVLQNVVSISMLLSTIMAGPLTLASSVIISPTSVISVNDIENVITQTMVTSAVLTLLLAAFTLYTFLKARTPHLTYRNLLHASRNVLVSSFRTLLRANPIRVFVVLLAFSQLMIGVGGLLWFFVDTTELNDSSQRHSLGPGLEAGVIDPLDEPMSELSTTTTSEPQILRQLHKSRLLSPRRSWLADHHMELGYKTLSSLRYILSAGGLMMAQFCVLSLVLVIAATKLRDRGTGRRVSKALLKTCLSVLVCLVLWLIYDSEKLVHLPVEASLPSSAQSLCVRLIYNVTILAISLPIFALMIRTDNRIRDARQSQVAQSVNIARTRTSSEAELDVNTFVKRRFVTSSASLSSDASSAATSNTNLDSAPSSGPCGAIMASAADSVSAILDAKLPDGARNSTNPTEPLVASPSARMFGSTYASSPQTTNGDDLREVQPRDGQVRGNTDINNNDSNAENLDKSLDYQQFSENEFNEYSILIVFMLINSTLNLFSVAQKLLHEEPVGTFRQIEVIGIAFEFGQGLLTFLIYGTKGLFDCVLCRNMSRSRP